MQAIKCRLQDINPIGDSWPENAADHMATICDGKDLQVKDDSVICFIIITIFGGS